MTTHSVQYTQGQLQMRRYMWCLLGAIGVLCVVGMSMLYVSTSYAYQSAKLDEESKALSEEIATLESAYKEQTASFSDTEFASTRMTRYSPGGEHVRYARVGGSVYSMLSLSNL